MSKKGSTILGVIVVVVILVVGGILIHNHKSTPPVSSTTNAPAVNNAVLITKNNAAVGQYLATTSGKALYTYNGDTSGVSNVTGSLLVAWPAYIDTGSTTNLPAGVRTIKRTDNGQIQYTYNGLPLYTFVSDGSGQVTGDGVSNFKIAKPASTSTSTNSSSTAPAASSTSTNNGYSY